MLSNSSHISDTTSQFRHYFFHVIFYFYFIYTELIIIIFIYLDAFINFIYFVNLYYQEYIEMIFQSVQQIH